MKKLITILTLTATAALAGPTTLVYQNESGVWVEYDRSYSAESPQPAHLVGVKEPGYRGVPYETNLVWQVDEFDTATSNLVEVLSYPTDLPRKHRDWDGVDMVAMTQAERDAVDEAVADAEYGALVASGVPTYPLLTEPPAPSTVPDPGAWFYLLTTNSIYELYYMRKGDAYATLHSSHDESGKPINRTILVTETNYTVIDYSIEEWFDTLKNSDKNKVKKEKKVKKTKKAKK